MDINNLISESKRHKIRENKTIVLPKRSRAVSELEADDEMPKQNLFKRLFVFRKRKEKAAPEITGDESKIIKPSHIEEPEILKEIDTGHHTQKVEQELSLWLVDGREVRSLDELKGALKKISTSSFNHHREKHDIVDWIKEIAGNDDIAMKLERAKTKEEAVEMLEDHKEESKRISEDLVQNSVLKLNTSKKEIEVEQTKQPKVEIQQAIQTVQDEAETKTESDIEQQDEKLAEEERLIDTEEERLHKKRIETASKRYDLIKKRAELEKERFEKILKQHEDAVRDYKISQNEKMLFEGDCSKEKIKQLMSEARSCLARGDSVTSEKIRQELISMLEFSTLDPKENKQVEYEILELEADIKLAALA